MPRTPIPWGRLAAEFVVIVIGVLVALGVDGWAEGRALAREEGALLRELRTTLQEDMEAVRLAADTISAANDRLPSAARHFESGDLGSRDPDHQAGMQALMRFTHLNLRFGPFETLKVRGLDLISDRDLRVALTSLYEDRLPALIENADIDQRLSRDRILPFMLEHFELDEDMNWLLAGDEPEARSGGATLARYREETLVRFYLRSYVDAITLMEETLARIDEVLG